MQYGQFRCPVEFAGEVNRKSDREVNGRTYYNMNVAVMGGDVFMGVTREIFQRFNKGDCVEVQAEVVLGQKGLRLEVKQIDPWMNGNAGNAGSSPKTGK